MVAFSKLSRGHFGVITLLVQGSVSIVTGVVACYYLPITRLVAIVTAWWLLLLPPICLYIHKNFLMRKSHKATCHFAQCKFHFQCLKASIPMLTRYALELSTNFRNCDSRIVYWIRARGAEVNLITAELIC